MGCDGGTICDSRDFIVKLKKSRQRMDKKSEAKLNWRLCRVSKQTLDVKLIVACRMGYLYNKDALLQYLMQVRRGEKKPFPFMSHVRHLKDVCNVHLTPNPNSNASPESSVMFVCPISGKEINAQGRNFLMRPCGHVISEEALQMVRGDKSDAAHTCLLCGVECPESEVTPVNPAEDVEEQLREQLDSKAELHVVEKKKLKRKDGSGKRKLAADPVSQSKTNKVDRQNKMYKSDSQSKRHKSDSQLEKSIVPKGATPEVWNSLFIDSNKKQEDTGKNKNDFLDRSLNYLVVSK